MEAGLRSHKRNHRSQHQGKPVIAIIDTGGANLASVSNALDRLSIHWQFTTDAKTIQAASHVILPGVGAAKDSMQRLDDLELAPVIRSLRQPVLGICLGMQLLFKGSDEGVVNCLGAILVRVFSRLQLPKIVFPQPGPSVRGHPFSQFLEPVEDDVQLRLSARASTGRAILQH